MPGSSSTPTTVTSAGYVPRFARDDAAYADSLPAAPAGAEVPRIAPELMTQVMTLEAANEARRVIADARRRLAEIAARAPQAPLVLNPDETSPLQAAPVPTLHPIGARRTPPTLLAPSPTLRPLRPVDAPATTTPARQDPPAPVRPAGGTGVSREYEWEQAVKAPFERPAAAPPALLRSSAGPANAEQPVAAPRTGLSREYEWELTVKAPFQAAGPKGPIGVLESLRSAAFPSPNPMPDQRRSERR